MKFVKHEPEGAGQCADKWSLQRLEYKKCNMIRCKTASVSSPLPCNDKLDVVLLLDGSGSLGETGWKAEMKTAQTFVDAFAASGPPGKSQANMAVILYSGPSTWSGVFKCVGKSAGKVDMVKTCKVETVQTFTRDMRDVKKTIAGLQWPSGSTLTSVALMSAKAELANGRGDAKSIVVVFTDGRPLSYRKTGVASKALRKTARLIWVPVTKFAPLKKIKKWATRRWQENVVKVNSFEDLEKPEVVTHIIADICPAGDSCECFYCGGDKLFPTANICGPESDVCSPKVSGNGCYTKAMQACKCADKKILPAR